MRIVHPTATTTTVSTSATRTTNENEAAATKKTGISKWTGSSAYTATTTTMSRGICRLRLALFGKLIKRCSCSNILNENSEYYDAIEIKRLQKQRAPAAAARNRNNRGRRRERSIVAGKKRAKISNSEPNLIRVIPSPFVTSMNPAGGEIVMMTTPSSRRMSSETIIANEIIESMGSLNRVSVVGIVKKNLKNPVKKVCSSPIATNNEFTTVTSLVQKRRTSILPPGIQPFMILSSSDRSSFKNEVRGINT